MKTAYLFSLLAVTLLFSCGEPATTPNGFDYEILSEGTSGVEPQPENYAFVHLYVMYDDSLVNSTRNQGRMMPLVVPDFENLNVEETPGGKPNPFQDMLAVMNEGDSARVFVPIDEEMRQQNPTLAGVNKLSYDIVLHEVKTEEQYQAAKEADRIKAQEARKAVQLQAPGREGEVAREVMDVARRYTAGELEDDLQDLGGGLKMLVVEEGNGPKTAAGKEVNVNYYGVLTNGTMFDNSFKRGTPFSFPLGQGRVIKGWDQGVANMRKGTKAYLFIPPDLAYGSADRGTIPPNSELIFYIEVM